MWLDPVPASLPVHHRAFLRRVLLAAFTLALLVLIALGVLLYGGALWALGGLDQRRLGALRE